MRILWVTAMPIKNIANSKNLKSSGGWIGSMIHSLSNNKNVTKIQVLAIGNYEAFESLEDNIEYVQLKAKRGVFSYNSNLKEKVNRCIDKFEPDIIDVQGVEFFIGNLVLENKYRTKVVFTLQGLVSQIWRKFFNDIDVQEITKYRTLRGVLHNDSLLKSQKKYKTRGENEEFLLKNGKFFIGRTDWDKFHCLGINENANYFHCGRNLREEFYNSRWEIEKANPYQLFTTQAHYPIKGLHILLEAIHTLKKDYPKIKLVVAGKNFFTYNLKARLKRSEYDIYLIKLIKKYDLEKNIEFTGWLNASELIDKLKKTHVFVCPSTIENSPNSLAEAQILGLPCVASNVGGIPTYVEDDYSGILYSNNDYLELSHQIDKIFKNDQLALKISKNARQVAQKRHDKIKNAEDLFLVYKSIINEK